MSEEVGEVDFGRGDGEGLPVDDDESLVVPDEVQGREAVVDDAAGAVEEGLGEGVDQVPRGVWGRAARGGGWSRTGRGIGQADEGGGVAAFEGAAGDAVEVGLVGESAEHGAKPVSDGLEAAVGGEGGVESVVPVGVRGVG